MKCEPTIHIKRTSFKKRPSLSKIYRDGVDTGFFQQEAGCVIFTTNDRLQRGIEKKALLEIAFGHHEVVVKGVNYAWTMVIGGEDVRRNHYIYDNF